jgi:hypothetical protein
MNNCVSEDSDANEEAMPLSRPYCSRCERLIATSLRRRRLRSLAEVVAANVLKEAACCGHVCVGERDSVQLHWPAGSRSEMQRVPITYLLAESISRCENKDNRRHSCYHYYYSGHSSSPIEVGSIAHEIWHFAYCL